MKKSLVVIALIVAALCSLFVFSVSATEQENIHISSTEFQVRQGEEFTTTIYISDNANIIDFDILLKYDTEKLTLISATENEDIKGAVVINAKTAGSIRINYSKTSDNVTKKTLLVDLTFRVDEYLPSSVYDCLTVDKSGAYVAHRLVNGLLEEVDFNCKFAPLNIYEMGDVDLNHKVDIGDATYIRRHLAKLHALTEFQLLFANTQNDDIIDIADAVALQRNLAKLEVDGYGDRINILFCNTNGEILTKKSVKIGADLKNVPDVPFLSGYTNGRWSLSKSEYIAPDYTNLTSELIVYAIYEKSSSPYMQYYISQINSKINPYHGVIDRDLALDTEIFYDENRAYTGKIVWRSSDARIISAEGIFKKQTYDQTITLTATITSYLDDGVTKESSEILTFTLLAKGAYSTPTKSEIVKFLQTVTNGTLSGTSTITGGEIDRDLNLIRKISNEQVGSASSSVYEVRIEWLLNNNGVYEPISQIQRGTSAKTIDLVATITFNGEPLEDDGKVYFDNVSLTAITEDEIRHHIINEIASKVNNTFSSGDTLWADDTTYGCEIKWISGNINTVTIEQNTVTVNAQAIDGTTCPIKVQVTYPTDSGSSSFDLEYVITVANNSNALLRPGVNISDSLYHALLMETSSKELTTETLKDTKFVSLDLSKYNDWFEDGAGELHAPITDLTGLTYCENLRLLNISGLNITSGISEIAGLTYLESFIANNVNISSEAVGGTPILDNMIGLKLVDLSRNDLTSLNMFFSSTNIYSKLKELYLDNNNLSDISLLSQTPMLTLLTLSNNNIESDDISVLADKTYLTYLSLNNNNISDISSLNKLTALTELRLHCNNISNITALKNMTAMKKLYLGDNNIFNIDTLEELTILEILYLNNNDGITDISALIDLTAMQILNLSNCSINQIVDLQNMIDLKELYAENNEITGFTTLAKFTSMEKLLLAGNERSGQVLEWNKYIGNMSNLKVLTLSGLDVCDLSFLETSSTDPSTQTTTTTIKPIERLEIADCAIMSTYTVGETSIDNMELLKKLELTLKYLDISNNPMEDNIAKIGYLTSLELLYADNIDIGDEIVGLMASSQSMKYLSLENCNISNMYNTSGKPWLASSRKYVYIDLAQNPLAAFDFSFVESSSKTLNKLYLDTTAENSILYSTSDFDDNVLSYLSLEGFAIDSIQLLPTMTKLLVLNISDTGIEDLFGVPEGETYSNSIARFNSLKYFDISGNDGIFTQSNLNLLYDVFHDLDTIVYLYDDQEKSGFDAAREMAYINEFALQDTQWLPYGGNIVNYRNNNDNGLSRSEIFNEFAFVWSTDDSYVSVNNNVLSVTNIAIPSETYIATLVGQTELYGQICSISVPVEFYKEAYRINYVLDSASNSYSHRDAINDSRNVARYAVTGNDIPIYDPTRGAFDRFLGWYEDADYTKEFVNDLKDNPRDVTLYAKWDVATYYDSIDETPWSPASGRVVIDWSKEADTNLLNHTSRAVQGTRYNNIDINPGTTEITFIGDPSKTYTNFRMHLCGFADGQKITIRFWNFKFVTNENTAIGLYLDSGANLTIDVWEDCSISTYCSSGSIIGTSDSHIKYLTFTGNGTMNITAGNGVNGASTGASGTHGGVAIYAEETTVNMMNVFTGTLNVTGGNGGNGTTGSTGTTGSDGERRDWVGGKAGNGGTGGTGGTGGHGGAAGHAIVSTKITITSGLAKFNGGSGGSGGKGGTGGTGGHGGYSNSWGTEGGDGGNGGTGGTGGNGKYGATGISCSNVEVSNSVLAVLENNTGNNGKAGAGGAGGAGGAPGCYDGAGWDSGEARMGDWGKAGATGSSGTIN